MTAADIARMCNCPQCWSRPGVPCTPWGEHLARYQRAERRGLLSRDVLAAVVTPLEVVAPYVTVPETEGSVAA